MKYFVLAALLGSVVEAAAFKQRKVEEVMDHFGGYTADYDGFIGNNHEGGEWRYAYNREVPEQFVGNTADTFTGKMIRDFAVEGHDDSTGKPNGQFFLTKSKTKDAAYEVLATHLDLKTKKEQDAHLNKYFDAVWKHMDVNDSGKLEAVEINKFMRTLCKPVKDHIILE